MLLSIRFVVCEINSENLLSQKRKKEKRLIFSILSHAKQHVHAIYKYEKSVFADLIFILAEALHGS